MSDKPKEESEFEKFRKFAQRITSVPKAEIDRREKEYQKERHKKSKRRGA